MDDTRQHEPYQADLEETVLQSCYLCATGGYPSDGHRVEIDEPFNRQWVCQACYFLMEKASDLMEKASEEPQEPRP